MCYSAGRFFLAPSKYLKLVNIIKCLEIGLIIIHSVCYNLIIGNIKYTFIYLFFFFNPGPDEDDDDDDDLYSLL